MCLQTTVYFNAIFSKTVSFEFALKLIAAGKSFLNGYNTWEKLSLAINDMTCLAESHGTKIQIPLISSNNYIILTD